MQPVRRAWFAFLVAVLVAVSAGPSFGLAAASPGVSASGHAGSQIRVGVRSTWTAAAHRNGLSLTSTTPTANARIDAAGTKRSQTISLRSSTSSPGRFLATKGASEAFHYTARQAVQSIEKEGLRRGSYAARKGDLSPLQAQIDLALPPNRGLRDAVVRVDLAGLRKAGYEVPDFRQVGRKFNMPGGGQEVQFPYSVPPRFLRVMRP